MVLVYLTALVLPELLWSFGAGVGVTGIGDAREALVGALQAEGRFRHF